MSPVIGPRQSPELKKQRFAWLDHQVLVDPKLPGSAFKVAYSVSDGFNDRDYDGRAFKSCKTIADEIGMSEATVIAMVRRLHANGHIRVEWGQQGRGHPNNYWMILKPATLQVLKTGKPQPAKVLDEGRKPQPAKVSAKQKTLASNQENLSFGQIKPQPAKESHWTGAIGEPTRVRPPGGSARRSDASPGPSSDSPSSVGHQSSEGEAETEGFARFWSVYPRKVGRDGAEAAFKRARQRASDDELIAAAERYAADTLRQQTPERYIKYPARWLDEGHWSNPTKATGILDQHGNSVAASWQQPPSDLQELGQRIVTDLYPNNEWD